MSKKLLLDKCETLGIKTQKYFTKEKLNELISSREKIFTMDLGLREEKVSSIYHIADVHIRVMERHCEYKEVFERLYTFLSSKKDISTSIVVICGDVFHNKDRFVSETILLFNEFIKELSKITHTFVIIGNHDCFQHTDRLDSLSGIVDIANHKNLFLLKKSGVYTFKNIQFGVSSLIDSIIVSSENLEPGFVKVALYHGCVGKVSTDAGGIMEGIDINKFSGYDLCLLGDIHKRQYLDKAKTIAYPGSLIQQNHAEDTSHGLLVWDLNTLTSEYVEIKNDYSFITLELNDSMDLEKIAFTKYSRVRLLIDDVDDVDMEKITCELEKFTKVLSIKKILSKVQIDTEVFSSIAENLCEKEQELIKSMVQEEDLENVMELHKKYSSNVSVAERDSMSWTIDYMEFKNIFSYGNDTLNRINFKDGITGILGENAIGKSSILNTILYGVFGNVYKSQSYSNKNIISKFSKKENLYVKISISMDGWNYIIEREAKNKKRATGIGMEETVRFYSISSEGTVKELNLATKPETENLIKDRLSILNKQEFILTNLLSNVSYGSNNNLLSMSNAQLEETFEALFDLEKYSTLHSASKTDYKTIVEDVRKETEKIKFLEASISKINIDDTDDKLEKASEKLKATRKSLKDLGDKLETIEKEIIKHASSGRHLEDKEKIIKLIKEKTIFLKKCKELEKILKEEKNIESSLISKQKEFVEYEKYAEFANHPINIPEDITRIEIELEELEKKRSVIKNVPEFSEDYMKAKKILKKLSRESATALDLTKILQQIKDLVSNDTHCILPFDIRDEIVTDLSTKSYIDPLELLRCKKLISDKEERDRKINENIENEENIQSMKKKLRNKRVQVAHHVKSSILSLELELKYIDAHYTIIELKKDLEYLEKNKRTNELVSEKSKTLEQSRALSGEIELLILKINNLEKDIDMYEKVYTELEPLIKNTKQNKKKLKPLKTYVDIVHPKKLPKIIIKDTIERICTEANKIIYNMTGLLCFISEVNDKWEISLKKNNLFLGPEHCSGYERFIINTGLKMGLDKFKFLSSVKMFLIDEVIDCVSEENIEKVYDLFDILKKHYKKVIVISHNEELKKKIEYKIDIQVDKKSSFISN